MIAGGGAKLASPPLAVTPVELSRAKVPSLDKGSATPHALFRSPLANPDRTRGVAHRVPDLRLLFTPGLPRKACWPYKASPF